MIINRLSYLLIYGRPPDARPPDAEIKLSEARSKLTRLDKLLKPGEALQINKRGKPYARIEPQKRAHLKPAKFLTVEDSPQLAAGSFN